MTFGDTNAEADAAAFGPAVSAMLVTYLKRHSQFVVVERENLDHLLGEWERVQEGKTRDSLDKLDAEILERIDVILQGEVTLLGSSHLEVDARLLSRHDGRVVTAAERSGPTSCLRQVVERLGIVLEQDFLRPYYGSLRVSLDQPENTRIFLKPVLRANAMDEEKPPVELEMTVYPGDEQDRKVYWVTNPTTRTLERILGGWYTLRLERPGYRSVSSLADRYQAVEGESETRVCYWSNERKCTPLDEADPKARRYIVQVTPRVTQDVNLTDRGFELTKSTGTIRITALDEQGTELPEARFLLRSLDLDINPGSPDRVVVRRWPMFARRNNEAARKPTSASSSEPERESGPSSGTNQVASQSGNAAASAGPSPQTPKEAGSVQGSAVPEESCTFFSEEELPYLDYGERLVRSHSTYSVSNFRGGFLAFENYRDEEIPSGTYEMVIWAPNYVPVHRLLHVADGDGVGPPRPLQLQRLANDVTVFGRSESQIRLQGKWTGADLLIATDPKKGIRTMSLPVDDYTATAQILGRPWKRRLNLMPIEKVSFSLDRFLEQTPSDTSWLERKPEEIELPVKSSLWVGGRTGGLIQMPGVFYDPSVEKILDKILSVSEAGRQVNLLEGNPDDLENLEERLEELDLLILNETDMSRLRVLPTVAGLIGSWVASGRSLMAFVSVEGDYSDLLGGPLVIGTPRSRQVLVLEPAHRGASDLREKIDLGAPHPFPKLKQRKKTLASWRVVSHGKSQWRPRILERNSGAGYALIWLQSSRIQASMQIPEKWLKEYLSESSRGALRSAQDLEKMIKDLDKLLELESTGASLDDLPPSVQGLLAARRKSLEANDRLLLLRVRLQNRALDQAEEKMRKRLDSDRSSWRVAGYRSSAGQD